MRAVLKAGIGALVLAALAAGAVIAFLAMRAERKREEEMEAPVQAPSRLARGPEREVLVVLDAETRKRIALQVEPLAGAEVRPERVAYGRLQEDPSRATTVRAPVAGVLAKSDERAWPALGEKIPDGTVIGRLVPRFSAAERADLQSRLAAARSDAEQAKASLVVSRAALARARTLNAEEKNISDRALQEAEARVVSDEIRLKSAGELASMLEGALAGKGAAATISLTVESGGEVVEALARPGEAVESGQALLRLARYDTLLARVTLPAGESLGRKGARAATIEAAGAEGTPLKAEWVASAPADPLAPGETHLFRVSAGDLDLRPGLAVTARIALSGDPLKGVIVPPAAVVRFGGTIWAYVETAEGKFARREMDGAQRLEKGWLVPTAFKPGDKVVVAGAGLLLSEELKSRIDVKD